MRTIHPTRTAPQTAAGEVLLKVEGLRVKYGGIEALKGVSLEVRRGEVVALGGREADKTRAVASKYGVAHVTTELGEALALPGVDAAILAKEVQRIANVSHGVWPQTLVVQARKGLSKAG